MYYLCYILAILKYYLLLMSYIINIKILAIFKDATKIGKPKDCHYTGG